MQYLRARYYSPRTGRFISKDTNRGAIAYPKSLNRYEYCYNNPILYRDISGRNPLIIVGAVVGAIAGAASVVVADLMDGGEMTATFNDYASAAVGGAVTGAIIGATGGTGIGLAAYAGAAAESLTSEAMKYAFEGKEFTSENIATSGIEIVADTVIGGTINYATGKVGSILFPTNVGWFKPQSLTSAFTGKYATQLFYKSFLPTLTFLSYGKWLTAIGETTDNIVDFIHDIFYKETYNPYKIYRPKANTSFITAPGIVY